MMRSIQSGTSPLLRGDPTSNSPISPTTTNHRRMTPANRRIDRSLLRSTRFWLAILGFFGFALEYAMRVNLSVALVCMLNRTAVEPAPSNEFIFNKGSESDCELNVNKATKPREEGQFEWDKRAQGILLGAFFWGYILTQIPAGRLSDTFGAKPVVCVTMCVSGLCTLLSPVAAQMGLGLFIALRIVLGMSEGFMFPAMHSFWSNWAPPLERSILITICYAGAPAGTVIALMSAGVICENLGWSYVFYITGIACLIWCVLWWWLSSSSPLQHSGISDDELTYIQSTLSGQGNQDEHDVAIPWRTICTSWPVWAIIVMHTGANFGNYMPLTELPTYMSEVLKFDETQVGLWSGLPYALMLVTQLSCGSVADFLRSRRLLSTKNTRKLLAFIAFTGQAIFLISASYFTCEQRGTAVLFVFLAQGAWGISQASYMINHVDIAPKYAGTLLGISNMFATLPGIIAPYVASALTPHGSQSEWRLVFWLSVGVELFCLMFYLCTAQGETQSWAVDDHTDAAGRTIHDVDEEKSD